MDAVHLIKTAVVVVANAVAVLKATVVKSLKSTAVAVSKVIIAVKNHAIHAVVVTQSAWFMKRIVVEEINAVGRRKDVVISIITK